MTLLQQLQQVDTAKLTGYERSVLKLLCYKLTPEYMTWLSQKPFSVGLIKFTNEVVDKDTSEDLYWDELRDSGVWDELRGSGVHDDF